MLCAVSESIENPFAISMKGGITVTSRPNPGVFGSVLQFEKLHVMQRLFFLFPFSGR
jgi:hypothetical protein